MFSLSEGGTFRIHASIVYNAPAIAQSECNITLNGELMTLVQSNGTEGKVVKRKLNKIQLEEGVYELGFDFISTGVEVKTLTFLKE